MIIARSLVSRPAIWLLITILVVLASLSALLAAGKAAADDSIYTAFFPWTAWTEKTGPLTFDMNRCKTLQAGDVNGDSRTDLICPYDYGNADTATFVQLSNGTDFSRWTAWTEKTGPLTFDMNRCKTLQAGDVNGDGRTDLVCPYDYGNAETATFVQLSSGADFSRWTAWTEKTGPLTFDMNRCKTLQMGDLNGDGRTDLVCPYDYGNADTATFVQLSSGADFSRWTAWTEKTGPLTFDMNRCKTLQVGDLNGDGRTDLVCPYDYGNADTATFVQLSSGADFSRWTAWTEKTGPLTFDMNRCKTLQVGDLNGDGRTDLVCPYDYGNAETATFVQLSSGADFSRWTAWTEKTGPLTFDMNRCKTLQVGDLNGDGRTDLVCPYDYGNADTATFVQLSSGADFSRWTAWTEKTGPLTFDMNRCKTLQVGDVNADGLTALICPYDYGNADTATFVQRVQAYRQALPAVMRP